MTGEAWSPLLAGLLSLSFVVPSHAQADRLRLEPMVVQTARPDKAIRHDVEFKSVLDSSRREVLLKGPTHHSVAAALPRLEAAAEARLNWYAIAEPWQADPGIVIVSLEGAGGKQVAVRLEKSVYFLSTTKKLAEGKPPPAPKALSHFVAYRIQDGQKLGQTGDVEVTTGAAKTKVRLKDATFLCVPAEEWHHGELFPVHDRGFCMIVFTTAPFGNAVPSKTGTLDQFGLNSLQLGRAELVGVAARLSNAP